jgi:hypothetical protein
MRPGQFAAEPLWWEIAYVGGTRVRGTGREEWIAAPQDGVLVVRQPVARTYETKEGRRHFTIRCTGHDYYWLGPDGSIMSGQAKDLPDAMDSETVKRGAWAEREEYLAAYNAFLEDIEA